MKTRSEDSGDSELTAEDRAALDAQRGAPVAEAPVEDAAQIPAETPQEGAGAQEAAAGVEQAAGKTEPPAVPYERFKEANDRRKEIERQAAEDRRRYEARLEEVLKLVPQPGQSEAKPAEQPLPDYNQDPAGYIVANMQRQGATIEQIHQELSRYKQREQEQQLITAVIARADAAEKEYKIEHPEYDAAFAHLQQFHDGYLRSQGWVDPVQRAQKLMADKFAVVAAALQQGVNPAERLHRMAEAAGWKPAAPPPHEAFVAERPAAAVPTPAEQIQMAQRGQEHARALGAVRGNGPAPMTAAKLLEIPDDNFDEIIKAMRSKAARPLMGA